MGLGPAFTGAGGASLHNGLPWENMATIEQRPIWIALTTPQCPCGLPTVGSVDFHLWFMKSLQDGHERLGGHLPRACRPRPRRAWRRHRGTQDARRPYHYHPKICLFNSKRCHFLPKLSQLPLKNRPFPRQGGASWCLDAHSQGRRMQTLSHRPHTIHPKREQASCFFSQRCPRSPAMAAQAQV